MRTTRTYLARSVIYLGAIGLGGEFARHVQPVVGFQEAPTNCGTARYLEGRDSLHERLLAHGVPIRDARPQAVGPALISRYLAWKKAVPCRLWSSIPQPEPSPDTDPFRYRDNGLDRSPGWEGHHCAADEPAGCSASGGN